MLRSAGASSDSDVRLQAWPRDADQFQPRPRRAQATGLHGRRMGSTICGMIKTTVYLPEDLDARLDSEAIASGVTKAELIRRGISMLLARSQPRDTEPLPVFESGKRLTPEQMDDAVYEQIRERAARR
jgi:Ribbon-helix-helix protein, copG family